MPWRWPRRRQRAQAGLPAPDPLASALIHLGQAWRAHQEGRTIAAVYHLRQVVDATSVLLITWERDAPDSGADPLDGPL